MKKRTAAVTMAAVMAASTSMLACAEETPTLDAIKEAGKLVVGTSADYPPYEFHTEIDGEDTIVGFDIAIAQYIADSLEVEMEVVDMPFDSLLIGLGQGDFDLVMAGMTPTEERQKSADFSDIFWANDQLLIVRAEDADTLNSIDAIQGHQVGAQTGSIPYDLAVETVGAENVIGLVKTQDLIMELKSGKIDGIFSNTLSGSPYVAANDDLALSDIGLPNNDGGFAAAIGKGHEDFVAYVNEQLDEMAEKGLIEQYVNEAVELAGVTEE